MNTFDMIKIVGRCTLTGCLSLGDILRMAAYGILAVQAARATNGNMLTYKMHVGAMRATYRRAIGVL